MRQQGDEGVPYSILLRQVCINDTCTELREQIELRTDDHVLRFRCLLPSFRNAGQVRFLYQLQGMEYTWHSSSDGRILYTGLSPGSYLLAVQADLGEGVWTRRQQLITVIVQAPLFESVWLWLALIPLALLIGYLLQRQRHAYILLRERRRLESEKRRLHNN
jgi:hypothetical protein